ncbi:transporter substrate-binding domain-containing protein [Kitasatospora sp. NPDC058190]|uniref:transporter substrate-binding domain-containing protein n=1 Tax=Kitasatospora sp. NPDC058190 TaxID=3346371 RepID=UPI0036DBC980
MTRNETIGGHLMRLRGTTAILALTTLVAAALTTGGPARPAATRTTAATGPLSLSLPSIATDTASGSDPSCKASKYPPKKDPSGPTIKAIQARGTINIGVDLNDYDWGFLGPDGATPQGFDIDLAKAIVASLGNPKVNWVALDDAQRQPRLKATGDQHVDLVVHTMTITCKRSQDVAMSTVYFEAGQRVLMPAAKAEQGESGPDAMKGRRVCVAAGSTAEALLEPDTTLPASQQKYKVATLDKRDQELDCLVQLELGNEDAIVTDDAIAYGLAAQDPQTTVVGDQLSDEPYGVAISPSEPDLASWVNQVLEDYRGSGAWRQSYDHWIRPNVPGHPELQPPAAQYSNS